LFEVELSRIDPFRNLVKALSVIVEEGTFNLDEAQIKLLAMDPSHVAMVSR
jgi:DNA polymerase III sliding clamp (beta) subunit (PCNA family)